LASAALILDILSVRREVWPALAAKGSKASAVMQNISSPISATTEECHVIFG
jgi:hypothetical protein